MLHFAFQHPQSASEVEFSRFPSNPLFFLPMWHQGRMKEFFMKHAMVVAHATILGWYRFHT